MKFENSDDFPFYKKKLSNPFLEKCNLLNLPAVDGVTVNEVSTRPERIASLKQYGAVESMEGAPLHYVCLQNDIPFIQIRAISNYVGERDKSKWQIKKALDNLNSTVIRYLEELTARQLL